MRRTRWAYALAPLLLASSAKADWTEGQTHLTTMLQNIGINPAFSAYWLDAMPKIAGDCGMKAVKAQAFNVAGHFNRQNDIGFYLQRIQSGQDENEMMTEWSKLDSSGHDRGCALADKLWGEDGDMFPGVLRKL